MVSCGHWFDAPNSVGHIVSCRASCLADEETLFEPSLSACTYTFGCGSLYISAPILLRRLEPPGRCLPLSTLLCVPNLAVRGNFVSAVRCSEGVDYILFTSFVRSENTDMFIFESEFILIPSPR